MKILVVTHYFASHRGGIEIVAGELARRYAAEGHEVKWAASAIGEAPLDETGVEPLPMQSWNLLEDRLGVPFPIWSPGSMIRLERAIRWADAVHIHDSLYPSSFAAAILSRRARKQVVITQHIGLVPYESRLLRGLMKLGNATVGRWTLRRADHVAFVSETVRRFFADRLPLPNALLVQNGVDSALYEPASDSRRQAVREALGIPPGVRLLLFVGRFVEKKGLPFLGRLAREIPEADWIFAGWGPLDPDEWRLPNVRVLRNRSGQDLVELYQAADLLVLPSVGEGFPLVVQEAMACGTPALISRETAEGVPGGLEVLWHEDIRTTDPKHWANRIRRLLADGQDLRRSRLASLEFARNHWDWSVATKTYLGLLRS